MNELSLVADQVKTSTELDGILREHVGVDQLAVHMNGVAGSQFLTTGTREWDDKPGFGWKAGKQWTFDTESNATLAWDYGNVPDDQIDSVPRHLICSGEATGTTPEEVWGNLPHGQKVTKLNFDLQFDKAATRWKAKGSALSIGAVLFSGHQAAIEDTHATNHGALGTENFPFVITGGIGAPARNLIAQLDPAKFILDANLPDDECSHITGSTLDGNGSDSTHQVTARMIVGNIGQLASGEYVQHRRAFCYQRGNHTEAKGTNIVQAHTIYECLRGSIDHNSWSGVHIGVYGDTFATKGLEISENSGDDNYGIMFVLSPRDPKVAGPQMADQFSHEGYVIGPNKLTSRSGADVRLDTLGPTTAGRFIRNITVDASLSLQNTGATNVARTGAGPKKGCNPFRRFRR